MFGGEFDNIFGDIFSGLGEESVERMNNRRNNIQLINKLFKIVKENNLEGLKLFKMKSGTFQIKGLDGSGYGTYDDEISAKKGYINLCMG